MATRAYSEPFWARHLAWMISGGFLFISLIYISVSDRLVYLLIDDPQRLTFVQSVKGWAFVILTAAMLFLLLHLAVKTLRRSQQSEQAANERYRRMIETTNEGVWILDRNGQTTFINQTMASMLRCERDDVLGQPQHAFLDDASNVTQVDQLARQCDGLRLGDRLSTQAHPSRRLTSSPDNATGIVMSLNASFAIETAHRSGP